MARLDKQERSQAEQDVLIAQVLGAPERVAMLRAIAQTQTDTPLSLTTLAAMSGLDVATVAAHIPVLVATGAFHRVEGASEASETNAVYCLSATPLAHTLCRMFAPMAPESGASSSADAVLDTLFDQMTNGVALYDASGVLTRLNPAGERITRRSPLRGETHDNRLTRYDMRRPDGTRMPVEHSPSGRALGGEVVSDMECIIDGRYGHETWLRCSAAPLRDEHGAIQGAIVIFADITEQRMLSREESLQRALAGAMIDHTFSGMAVFDVSDAFCCVRHNDNFLGLVGSRFVARGGIVGVPLDELFEGETRTRVRVVYEQVRETGEPYFSNEFSVVMPSHAGRRWFRLRLTPVRDERGSVNGLLMVVVEITELVAARETSRRHANELSAIIEAIPDAVMLADSSGRVVLSNSAVQRILGAAVADVPTGNSITAFHSYSPDERRLESKELPLNRALRGETVVSQELIYERPDGSRIDLLTSAAPVDLDDTGQITAAVSVFQDITRIKELERQRDDFLGIAAHELRTPLATILATLQAFLRRMQKSSDDHPITPQALSSGMERMYRQAQRLNKLVSDLLDVTRIRTGKLVYELEPCDLVTAVREAVSGQVAANPERKITLAVPDHPVVVIGDAFRLSQVVDNLVANALKYSRKRMPVTVSLDIEGDRALLRVVDKGVGIPPESVEQLFTRFYRVPGVDVQSGIGVGLGLGLHITESVIQRHGGQIDVRSAPGKGSTFIVSLPLLKDTDENGQ